MHFLIEMGGDIKQFENHKKLIAMAGLDPSSLPIREDRSKREDFQTRQQTSQTGDLADGNKGHPVQRTIQTVLPEANQRWTAL